MTKAEVIQQIQQLIIANGNEEITADVLRPILEAIVTQPNDAIGILSELSTVDKASVVAAINEVKQITDEQTGIVIHAGEKSPEITPPEEFSVTDYYLQNGSILWQYNAREWLKVERTNVVPFQETFIFKTKESTNRLEQGDFGMRVLNNGKLVIGAYLEGDPSAPESWEILGEFVKQG